MALTWLVIWIISYRLLLIVWPHHILWLIQSGIFIAITLAFLWLNLALNHRPEEKELLPRLGMGNRLSLLRGLFISLLAGFLFTPWPQGGLAWVIAMLYTAASVADWFDGFAARKGNQVTLLGQKLDIEFDALGIAVVTLLGIGYGQLPAWFILVALARYLFIIGLWWRKRTGKAIFDLPPSVHRRIMAGILMAMMTVVLWPIVPPGMAQIAAVIIAIPVLLGFLRDWLMVSGRLQPTNPTYLKLQKSLYILMVRWMPPLMRVILVVSMTAILANSTPLWQPAAWQDLLLSWHMPAPAFLATLTSLAAIVGTILVFSGIVGRIAAIFLLFPIGFDITIAGLTWANSLALICAFSITLLGTGALSLWQPEELIFTQRSGRPTEELETDHA